MFSPIAKMVNPLIASICKLALILNKEHIKAKIVLNKAPRKKKCSSGYRTITILRFTSKIYKKHCKTRGILRWEVSGNITDFTFPVERSNRKNNIGTKIVMIRI